MNIMVDEVRDYVSLDLSLAISNVKAGNFSVAIMGMGYVGIPLAEAFVNAGVEVIGVDINQSCVESLNSGKSILAHISDDRIKVMADTGKFQATTDTAMLRDADAILICVPTPLDKHLQPNLSFVRAASKTIAQFLRPGQIVILESTTYPGTTEEVIKPILEESGLQSGIKFGLAYSPEREDPGNIDFETSTIPKLVGADSPAERELAELIYSRIVSTVTVDSMQVAEAAKLTENIFRWVNIGLVNELKVVFDKMGINVHDVIDAAATKPFGFMAFYPGPGVGGHCIPIDPYYLSWKAREFGESTQFIDLAGKINHGMPTHVVSRLSDSLSRRKQKSLFGSRILLCGIAYKGDIDDMRESPSMEMWSLLERAGAIVDYYDPFIPVVPMTHGYSEYANRKSVDLSSDSVGSYDAVLIATKHNAIDYKKLIDDASLVIDTHNISSGFSDILMDKVVRV